MEIGKRVTTALNLPKDKFFKMRRTNPKQLEFIQSLGRTMEEAYPRYLAHKLEVEEEARRIFVFLEDRRQKLPYSDFLVEKGLYASNTSYFKIEDSLFGADGVKRFKVLSKLEKANELFDEFLTKHPIRITL